MISPVDIDNALAKNRAQPLIIEADEPVEEKPRHQQQFNAVRQSIGEQSSNAEMPVEEISDAECYRKRQSGVAGSLISEAAFGSRAVEKRVRVVQ